MDPYLSRIGRLLFGRSARLAVAAWIHGRDDPVFYQAEVVSGTGLPQSNIREELDRLVDLGMVSSLPRYRGSRRRYYTRQEHMLWAVVRAAVTAARSEKTRN
jgi:DNA-binding transcriptional ArsR family regulator